MHSNTVLFRRGVAAIALLAATAAGANDSLTDAERAWIESATPVLRAGRDAGLKVAIVVQPQRNAGESGVASAWQDGECQLVLTLRGGADPVAAATRTGVPVQVLREAVVAHELAHCVRQAGGEWHRWPVGVAVPAEADTPTSLQRTLEQGGASKPASSARAQRLAGLKAEMAATRREEGYADLAALAWVAARHPARYADVHAWLWALRDDGSPEGSHHDTRAWLTLARAPAVFDAGGGATPWAQALAPWRAGLR